MALCRTASAKRRTSKQLIVIWNFTVKLVLFNLMIPKVLGQTRNAERDGKRCEQRIKFFLLKEEETV